MELRLCETYLRGMELRLSISIHVLSLKYIYDYFLLHAKWKNTYMYLWGVMEIYFQPITNITISLDNVLSTGDNAGR